jgi:hypothetical protein
MISNASVKSFAQFGSVVSLLFLSYTISASEWTGYAAGEFRHFIHDSPYAEPDSEQASFVMAPEFYHEWHDGQQSLIIAPFLRVDSNDAERTHADLRELRWLYVADDWELRAGIGKVFWGVTESQHLVDVINQTDLIENTDTEDKLGQPMLNLSVFREWGTLDLFMLPYFRERTFAGRDGRFRPSLVIDADAAKYESGAKQHHVDWAIRWSQTFGDWDIGLSHFYGTNREPLFRLSDDAQHLIPYYELMHQTGLDIQQTSDAWLWKLELIRRKTNADTFVALTGGFEYTFYGVLESSKDMGVLMEVLFDDRDDAAITPFEHDILLGSRITWNDVQSSELLLGIIQDIETSEHSWNIEASRRIGQRWKASLEARFFNQSPSTSALFAYRNDDYIQLEIARYF